MIKFKHIPLYPFMHMESVFSRVLTTNCWGSEESVSGPGSTLQQTIQIREAIVAIVQKYNIQTFFDVPCGDFNWFRHIVHHIPNYIGGDIVKEIIRKNKERYNHTFLHFDIVNDVIPDNVDIVFCRDVFVHLPFDAIKKAFQNIKRSNAKYVLVTTFINRPFKDTHAGGWRAISFFNPPFSFPQPLMIINENCPESYPAFIDKSMGLWLVKDIPDF